MNSGQTAVAENGNRRSPVDVVVRAGGLVSGGSFPGAATAAAGKPRVSTTKKSRPGGARPTGAPA